MNTSEKQLSMQMILENTKEEIKKYRNTNKDLGEGVEHTEDHPDPDKEDSDVDLDDDGHVVQGEGVGEVGDDDQDGGREEGAQDGPENNLTFHTT